MGVDTIQAFSSRAKTACISINTGENSVLIWRDTDESTVTHTQDICALSTAAVTWLSSSSNHRHFIPEASPDILFHFLKNRIPPVLLSQCQAALTPIRLFSQLATSHCGSLGWNMQNKYSSNLQGSVFTLASVPTELYTTPYNTSSLSFKRIVLFWGTAQFSFLTKELKLRAGSVSIVQVRCSARSSCCLYFFSPHFQKQCPQTQKCRIN